MKIVFASGQSNMSGRGLGGPSLATVSPLVAVWNNANELGSHGSAFIPSPAQGNDPWSKSPFNDGNNLAAWFCDRLAKEYSEEVRLVLVSKGSSAISLWSAPSGDMWQEISDVWTATGLTQPADVFLWHQGESDSATGESTYKAAFLTLISNLENAGILSVAAPKIVGGIMSPSASTVNPWLQALAAENEGIYYASPADLPSQDSDHFTGHALHYFGYQRYWQAYCQHTGPRVVSGRVRIPGIWV